MESAKECVTTHLPNHLALKMDGAQVSDRDRAAGAVEGLGSRDPCRSNQSHAPVSRRAAVVGVEAYGVSRGGAATGADLGGSSKYSNESFED